MRSKFFLIKLCLVLFVLLSVKVSAQQLSPVSPKNGLVINNDSILLRWNKLNNALSYELKYTTDSNFIINVISINVGLQTAYWLTPLLSNTTYYWRVEGSVGTNTIIGQARRFTNFKPSDLNGCALWLRADTGLTLNGNNIASWLDASPNNLSVAQTGAASQPTLVPNSISGFPSLSFDGGDIFNISNFPFSNYVNCFVVAKKTNAVVNHGNITSAGTIELEMQTSKCVVVNSATGIVGLYDAVNWSQITLKRESTNSKAFFNGLQSGTTNTLPLNPIPMGTFSIGNRTPAVNSPAPFRGNISEIIVNTNQLADSQSTVIQNYLMDKYTKELSLGEDIIRDDNFCPVTITATSGFQSYLWSTGDTSASVTVNTEGIYYVQAVDLFNRIQTDSVIVTYPTVNQLSNPILCYGSQTTWNTNLSGNYSFLWQDGSNASSYLIDQAGAYFVKITDVLGCDFFSDTLNVILDNFPIDAFLGNDTSLCTGNTIQLQVGANQAVNYLWSNGTFNDSLIINNGGSFWLQVSNTNNCIATDTIIITLTGIAPIANFSNLNVCLGLPMSFNDFSAPATGDTLIGWEWSFNDGNTALVQNPIHLYDSAASYIVRLKVISQTGCAGLINKPVVVFQHPEISYIKQNFCEAAQTHLINTANLFGGNLNQIEWNFGDTASAFNIAFGDTVAHLYNLAGPYNLTMIVNTTEGCVDTLTSILNIKPSPIALFEHEKLCAGDTIKFKDISYMPFPQQNIFRAWTFMDTLTSNFFEPQISFPLAGLYAVKLIVMASNGCIDTLDTEVQITNKPIAEFRSENLCTGKLASFFNESTCDNCLINTNFWSSNGIEIGNTDTLFYTFSDSGAYVVSLNVTNNAGCSGVLNRNIVIKNNPMADFGMPFTFGSPPLEIQFSNLSTPELLYSWNFGDNGNSNLFEPIHVYSDTGTYQIHLTVTDTNGCFNEAVKQIMVIPKRIDVSFLNLASEQVQNKLETTVTFLNKSSGIVRNFDFLIQTNGNINNLIEHWEGFSMPGEIKQYKLKSILPQENQDRKADYLCLDIINVDLGKDEMIEDNSICLEFNKSEFIIANLFPNPVFNEMNLVLISPIAGTLDLSIIDSRGSMMLKYNYELGSGLNQISVETFQLPQGVYQCSFLFNNEVYNRTFLK